LGDSGTTSRRQDDQHTQPVQGEGLSTGHDPLAVQQLSDPLTDPLGDSGGFLGGGPVQLEEGGGPSPAGGPEPVVQRDEEEDGDEGDVDAEEDDIEKTYKVYYTDGREAAVMVGAWHEDDGSLSGIIAINRGRKGVYRRGPETIEEFDNWTPKQIVAAVNAQIEEFKFEIERGSTVKRVRPKPKVRHFK